MPLKLTVGLCKKLGLPEYGSLGASCSVELEVDQALLQHDLDAFQQQVQNAYTACRQAVQDELAREQSDPPATTRAAEQPSQAPAAAATANQEHRSGANGNGNGPYAASDKQRSYIQQLARQIKGLGLRRLDSLAQQMYGKKSGELSSLEASALIDQLKALKSGELQLEELLPGAAA